MTHYRDGAKYCPTHYAAAEGRIIQEWTGGDVEADVLETRRDPRHVTINGETVHALLFGWAMDEWPQRCGRWDCINGWTRKPPFESAEWTG